MRKYRCISCGSEKVQMLAWVSMNDNIPVEDICNDYYKNFTSFYINDQAGKTISTYYCEVCNKTYEKRNIEEVEEKKIKFNEFEQYKDLKI
jgi:hypothetical protein